ncbi:MAG: hypothetical protein UU47_C0002G0043 [candidate division TM6 bacterium GW2011_GWE2_41_16]|nr:MAG: hypothetical protein UU47_C0002G0043 [candidate division TM6 bacterium GW2011_GWE2_41_16]
MKNLARICACLALLSCFCIKPIAFTSLNKSDPYPFPNTLYPYDFLRKSDAFTYCDDTPSKYRCCTAAGRFTMAGYYQSATAGTGTDCAPICTSCGTGAAPAIIPPATVGIDPLPCPGTELGDLLGTWNVLGTLYRYNGEPIDYGILNNAGTATVNYSKTQVGIGANQIVGTNQTDSLLITNTPPPSTKFANLELEGLFDFVINPANTDIGTTRATENSRKFGFISVPIDYQKYGIRGQFFLDIACNFGLVIQGGLNNITQRPTFNDLTCSATNSTCPVLGFEALKGSVKQYFTSPQKFGQFAHMLGYDLSCFNQTGFEDTMVGLVFRGHRECNWDKSNEALPHLLFTPFFALQGSIPTGTTVSPRKPFAISSGNNGHWGVGGTIGCTIDFFETVDFGFDLGVDQFFGRRYDDMPVPTNSLQTVLYPYSADVDVHPGTNWTIGMSLNGYHLVDTLTLYAEYRGVFHKKDCFEVLSVSAPTIHSIPAITLNSNPETFTNVSLAIPTPSTNIVLTGKMENESCWNSQMLVLGLSYDITRFVHLGMGIQVPISQCNAYRTSTIFGALGIMF